MQLRFLGGAGSVSGSKVLVEHDGHRLLVDCGLFEGLKQLRLHNWSALPVPTSTIDAVVLTHAHIDHSGFLPRLVELGFKGRVFVTAATAELCQVLLPESGRLQEEQARFANSKGFSKHAPALPLYTESAAQRALEHLHPCKFDEAFEPVSGFELRLRRAGHVLGAASVHLRRGAHSVLFSGDLGSHDDPVMQRPAPPEGADYVLVESTYGNQSHRVPEALTRLAKIVNRTAARGGVVVVPAFAAGQAQVLLRGIQQLKAASRIPDIPVYLNSAIAAEVVSIYQRHAGEHRLSAEACASMLAGVTIARSEEEAMAMNELEAPGILVAAEGVANGGRVAHHLKAYASDARHAIVFAGHQAAGTRGAALLAGHTRLKIHGDWITVRAEVCALHGLSGHADRQDLLDWILALPRAPRHLYMTHGEPEAADSLRQAIAERQPWPCSVPEYLELVNI
ncbi:MAG TPA: MBL fold metallo-hydrolase [Rubrivivax sp.]|nr:MBL fold metallo-hydrolase [Rubrivivax sp.]